VTLDNTDISGLGTLAVVNDAPSDGSQYARKNAAWDVVIPGDRYLTTSTTSNTVSNGNKTLTIGTGLSYTPTQNITISYDASNHMHGEVLTYNSGTGVMTVDVNHHTGSGTYASWVVNVGGVTPATSVAFADITGAVSSNTNLQAALDLKANLASPALTGNVTITSNSTGAALFIQQAGTGNILTLHDQASDTTFVAIDQNGKVNTILSTTANAGFNIPHGFAPNTPVDGDFWTTTNGLFGRINSVTQQYVNVSNLTSTLTSYMTKGANLSDVNSVASARNNLQLGTAQTVAFRAVNLSEGAPEIDDTLSILNVITSSSGYGVAGSTASYVDDGFGAAIVSESGSFSIDKNNFSLALYPTYDSSNPSSPTSGIELNYVTATGVLSLRAYDNPGSTDYVTTLSPFGLILPASGGSITFGDATVQTTAFPGFAGYATETFVTSQGYITSAGVPAFATTEQAALNSSATTVISPANFRVAGLTTNVWAPGVAAMSTVVLGTGANVGSTTTVLNGRLLAPSALTAGYACRGFNLFLLSNSANAGYNFGTPSGHSIKIYGDLTPVTVGVKIRAVFGRQNNTLLAPATLASRGYGWEWNFATSTLSIIAHNGTTLTTTAVTWVPLAARNYEITTTSSGTGTISLYVDGALLGTSSGGPTTFSAAGQLWWQTEIQNEVTATAQREFYFQNPKVYTTNG
jgi:hypothetical protein